MSYCLLDIFKTFFGFSVLSGILLNLNMPLTTFFAHCYDVDMLAHYQGLLVVLNRNFALNTHDQISLIERYHRVLNTRANKSANISTYQRANIVESGFWIWAKVYFTDKISEIFTNLFVESTVCQWKMSSLTIKFPLIHF